MRTTFLVATVCSHLHHTRLAISHSSAVVCNSTTMSSSSSFDEMMGRKHKGAVIFTGPDGVGDHQVEVQDPSYIGHGFRSTESTSDTSHLYRAPKENPYPQAKSARVGEVGWGVVKLMDYSLLKSGHQIMLKEFRKAVEDRYTHRHQTPYYPPPEKVHQNGGPQMVKESKSIKLQEPVHLISSQESSKISLC